MTQLPRRISKGNMLTIFRKDVMMMIMVVVVVVVVVIIFEKK
jgi:ABC-type Mn2+/Zn2+ transport system permease subunit